MNIYEFSYYRGQSDWVFAPDIKEAKEFYLKFTGCGDLTLTTVKRLPKSEWNETYLLDPNESEPDEDEEDYNKEDYSCGLKIIETFADYAKRNTITDMIATTEY
jgi:hypothetical protein